MSRSLANRFGRKPGRGRRPWILLPKVLALGLSFGSLAACLALWLGSGLARLAPGDPLRVWLIDLVSLLTLRVHVPALVLTLVLGGLLFLQHPRQFIRMRWLLVKLASILLVVPGSHAFCASRLQLLRRVLAAGQADRQLEAQLAWGLLLCLIGTAWIIVLGRLKPRLGQNWARSFAASLKTPAA